MIYVSCECYYGWPTCNRCHTSRVACQVPWVYRHCRCPSRQMHEFLGAKTERTSQAAILAGGWRRAPAGLCADTVRLLQRTPATSRIRDKWCCSSVHSFTCTDRCPERMPIAMPPTCTHRQHGMKPMVRPHEPTMHLRRLRLLRAALLLQSVKPSIELPCSIVGFLRHILHERLAPLQACMLAMSLRWTWTLRCTKCSSVPLCLIQGLCATSPLARLFA